MTLLGWMHHKFQQSTSETHNHFSIGQKSLDDLQCYPKTNYCSKPIGKSPSEKCLRNSSAGLEAARVEEKIIEEESSAALTELFHGFLATGTIGTEPINTNPSTPTFSFSVDHIDEKETEVTENELKLLNGDLEKVLGSEGGDEKCNLSLGRNSLISAQSSIVTLGGKQIENAAINKNEGINCPLQSCLFGPAIGSTETAPPTKKEHRTSLRDLFHKTKLEEENPGDKFGRTEKKPDKSVVHILTRMMKRIMLHGSNTSSTEASGGHLDLESAEKKLLKILQMFHRKIHPESSTATRKSQKPIENEMKWNIMSMLASHNGGLMPTAEDIKFCPRPTISEKRKGNFKSQSYLPQFTLDSGNDSGNRERWVKTDADYLVLEL